MAHTVAQMTKDELIAIMEELIERKLLEIIGDPDEGLEIRESVRKRLLRQKAAVEAGERGVPLQDVLQKIQIGASYVYS
ncbi:MAG: hypothetical protein ACPGWR_12380 [Ardenticatenaceae bacterium]